MVRQISFTVLVVALVALTSCREEIPSAELPTVIHSVIYSLDNNLNLCGISPDQKHSLLNKLRAQWDSEKGKVKVLLEKKYASQGDKLVTDCEKFCSCSLWSDLVKDSKILSASFANILKAAQSPAKADSQACLENMRKVYCGSENLQALMAEDSTVSGQ